MPELRFASNLSAIYCRCEIGLLNKKRATHTYYIESKRKLPPVACNLECGLAHLLTIDNRAHLTTTRAVFGLELICEFIARPEKTAHFDGDLFLDRTNSRTFDWQVDSISPARRV